MSEHSEPFWRPMDSAARAKQAEKFEQTSDILMLFKGVDGVPMIAQVRHTAVPYYERADDGKLVRKWRSFWMFATGGSIEEDNFNILGWADVPAWMRGVRFSLRMLPSP